MNYENFTDTGLRMMHDAVHKAMTPSCPSSQSSPVRVAGGLPFRTTKRRFQLSEPFRWRDRLFRTSELGRPFRSQITGKQFALPVEASELRSQMWIGNNLRHASAVRPHERDVAAGAETGVRELP
jgi:hypothetical protein